MLCVFVACMTALEFGARYVQKGYYYPEPSPLLARLLNSSLKLDDYERTSKKIAGHWTLVPHYNAPPGDEKFGIRVNAGGFRGADLAPVTSGVQRILVAGDSVVFGTARRSFPEAMGEELDRCGISAEVINGGVEGYSTRNLWAEFNRFDALKPSAVILYVGWNDIFSTNPVFSQFGVFRGLTWLFDKARQGGMRMFHGDVGISKTLRARATFADPDDPVLELFKTSETSAPDRVIRLARRFQSSGADVFVLTLAGLINGSNASSVRVINVAHLPYFSANTYVLALLKDRFNNKLRALAQANDIKLIDVDAWVSSPLRRDNIVYSDSVHFDAQSLQRLGKWLAVQVAGASFNERCE